MAKHQRRQAPTRADEVGAFPLIGMPYPAIDREVIELWTSAGQRAIGFARARAGKCMHAASDLARATNPQQAIDAQSRYARELVDDYANEAADLAEVCTRCFMHAVEQARKSMPWTGPQTS